MSVNKDYVTVVKKIAEWLPGGGHLELREIGRSFQQQLPIFTCEAIVLEGTDNFPIKGVGRAKTLKDAKHEAARDFFYRLLLEKPEYLLDTLANDTSYCPINSRPTPELHTMTERNVDEERFKKTMSALNPDNDHHGEAAELTQGSPKNGQ